MENTHHDSKITWHTEVLPHETLQALELLSKESWFKQSDWYLAGGTALALYGGHRQSLDLDFFTQRGTFSVGPLLDHFEQKKWKTSHAEKGTVYGTLVGAKISFIAYPFFTYQEKPKRYGSIRILMPQDIAVMKVIAISQRGRKRDFVDLFWYTQQYEPLLAVIQKLKHQYATAAHNYHHILESMMYFADAEDDPMPRLFFTATWKEIKAYFEKEVPRIAKELLRLE